MGLVSIHGGMTMSDTAKERIIKRFEEARDRNTVRNDWGGEVAAACYHYAIQVVREELA